MQLNLFSKNWFIILSIGLISFSCKKDKFADEGGYEFHKLGNTVAMTTNSGCNLWDVSNPDNAYLLSRIPCGYSNGVRFKGNMLYVSTESGLNAYNLSNLSSPTLVGSVPCVIGTLFIKDNLIFVKDDGSVSVFDCTNPQNMLKLDEYKFASAGNGNGIFVADDYVYTANSNLWQLKYDTSGKLTNPKSITGSAWRLSSDGTYLYLSTYSSGIKIIDIRDSNDSKQVSTLNCGATWGITHSPGYVYVIDQHVGVRKIDISTITSPKQILNTSDSFAGHDLIYDNGYLYCAGMQHGFYILDADDLSLVFD